MPLRSRIGPGLLRPALGGAAVLALAAGAALAAPASRQHSHPPPAGTPPAATSSAPHAAPGTAPGSPRTRFDAIWAAARARHPEPPVTVEIPDRPIDCAHLKCIAFTFDDGPKPGYTGRLLRILATHHTRVTFMLVGRMVTADPSAVAEEARAGDMLGIHTWNHQSLRGRPEAAIADDITRTADAITKASGYRPWVIRPPYGAVGPKTAAQVPYPLIKWSVDSEDWRSRDPDAVFKQVTSTAAPGSIVLLHDTYGATIAATPRLLDYFTARGYTFVTVSELYGSALAPHRIYYGRERTVAANRAADKRAGITRPPWVDPPTGGPPVPAPNAPAAPAAEVATPAPDPSNHRRW